MENFHIVSALCRQVIKDGASEGVLIQLDRLYEALRLEGAMNEAKIIKTLINKANVTKALEPSKVELSRASYFKGQKITQNTKIPVDKDTGSPLAEIVFPEELKEVFLPILPADITYAISQLVEQWGNIDKLADYGVKPSLSCLLFGLPGTGKTTLAFYVAKMLGLPVVMAKLDGLVSSLLGTSARNITNLFGFASQHDCILLLDEFDAVAKARDDKREVGEIKRIVNTLLQCIDNRSNDGITIAITNHEILLDPAVWRRFDLRIFIPKPDMAARAQIINKYLPPLEFSDEKKKFLAFMSEGYSGSDIELMIKSFKRTVALKGKDVSFMGLVKSFISIYAGNESSISQQLRDLPEAKMMSILHKQYGFTQRAVARIFQVHQSTVSRSNNEVIDSV